MQPTPAPWTVSPQPLGLSILKLAVSLVSSALLVVLVFAIGEGAEIGDLLWPVLPALLLGYLAADLLSGTAHWFCDTFFAEDTPLIGKVLIQPFRDHHRHPQRITRYRFLEQDSSNFFLLLPFLILALWSDAARQASVWALFACCFLIGLALGSFFTNLFHKWAHHRRPPRLARWLQRCGLILSPELHQVHHRDHSRGFCVTSGWMNPLLDAVDFFPRVERWVRSLQR